MTRREADREKAALERRGWADVQIIMSESRVHRSYGVSAVDPATGVRTGIRWEYFDRLSKEAAR
jgi:hypothetical protein